MFNNAAMPPGADGSKPRASPYGSARLRERWVPVVSKSNPRVFLPAKDVLRHGAVAPLSSAVGPASAVRATHESEAGTLDKRVAAPSGAGTAGGGHRVRQSDGYGSGTEALSVRSAFGPAPVPRAKHLLHNCGNRHDPCRAAASQHRVGSRRDDAPNLDWGVEGSGASSNEIRPAGAPSRHQAKEVRTQGLSPLPQAYTRRLSSHCPHSSLDVRLEAGGYGAEVCVGAVTASKT